MTLPASLTVTAGGRTLTAAEAAVAAMRLELSSCGAHDGAELVLWRGSKLTSLAPGDDLGVALGEAGSEDDVFTGTVLEVEGGQDGLTIAGVALTEALSHSFRAQAYAQQSVSDIVRDLANDVEVEVASCDVRLESFCIDSQASAWDHILELAAISGCEASASATGALRFVPAAAAGAVHSLRYGVDLLGWRLGARTQSVAPAVATHGAASAQGSSRWHWLRNDPAPSAAGERTLVIGAFHAQGPADALADSSAAAQGRQATAGSVSLWGRPAVRPGDSLELVDLPGGDQTVRVRTVIHRLDGRRGFVTDCRVEGGDGGGGLLGALGL